MLRQWSAHGCWRKGLHTVDRITEKIIEVSKIEIVPIAISYKLQMLRVQNLFMENPPHCRVGQMFCSLFCTEILQCKSQHALFHINCPCTSPSVVCSMRVNNASLPDATINGENQTFGSLIWGYLSVYTLSCCTVATASAENWMPVGIFPECAVVHFTQRLSATPNNSTWLHVYFTGIERLTPHVCVRGQHTVTVHMTDVRVYFSAELRMW
jgi:hypothetical protein